MLLVGHDAGARGRSVGSDMIGGIKKFDDHPVFYNCVWNPDLLAAAVRQTTRQSCLSISWWAIQENPGVTIDGGPQEVEPG